MDLNIALLLIQDGLVNGAIYALVAMAIILVFAVTRVILFFQGELIAFSALSMVALADGHVPGTAYLLVIAVAVAVASDIIRARGLLTRSEWMWIAIRDVGYTAVVVGLSVFVAPFAINPWFATLLVIAIAAPIGPAVYRVAIKPVAEASVLTLLMISMGCHLIILASGLYVFGSEGHRGIPLVEGVVTLGPAVVSWHNIIVILATLLLLLALWAFFQKTVLGKTLRACAVNRVGARLIGIQPDFTGQVSFAMASIIAAIAGVMIAPISTIYYDSGFVIGLKGFVAAIVAGLTGYPLAVASSMVVSMTESFSSFWASTFKEVIVLMIAMPALFWRSLTTPHHEEDHD
jgi:branched-chain amino acid transport system permease protein